MDENVPYQNKKPPKFVGLVCRFQRVVPIVYGYPAPETFKKAEQGEVILGGGVVWEGRPTFGCTSCGAKFVKTKHGPEPHLIPSSNHP